MITENISNEYPQAFPLGGNDMGALPLVSIIVITYNSSKYVLETLESACAQTYENIELIVSDDCSTDNTVEICREWLAQNNDRFVRTELITIEKNTGIAPNCNRGVKAAKGEWVKLIAGDDILIDNCIKNFLHYIKDNGSALLISSIIIPFKLKDERKIFYPPYYIAEQEISAFLTANEQRKLFFWEGGQFYSSPSLFYRSKLFRTIGIFDERIPFIEDVPFCFNAINNGIKIDYMPISTIYYRNEDSITHDNNTYINKKYYKSAKIFRQLYPPQEGFFLNMIFKYHFFLDDLKIFFIIHFLNNKRSFITRLLDKLFFSISPFIWVQRIVRKRNRHRYFKKKDSMIFFTFLLIQYVITF